jgi:hypothetical protein
MTFGGKGCVIAVILLLSSITITSGMSAYENPSQTIYVDDDNTDGPWDGTEEHPFQYIQDGINGASNGDTVYVYKGIYNECNLTCNPSIKLTGQEREKTIINGTDKHANNFTVNTTTVTIQNFTFKKTVLWCTDFHLKDSPGKYAAISVNNNTLKDSMIYINLLFYEYTNGTVEITNNIILNNYSYAPVGIIFSTISPSVHILHNVISGPDIGIVGGGASDIIGNEISHCSSYGIMLMVLKDSIITINNNNFIHNKKHAEFSCECSIGKEDESSDRLRSLRVNEFLPCHQMNLPLQTLWNKGRITWNHNYWDNWRGIGPKMITGTLLVESPRILVLPLPWLNFDWFPAKEPYDIGY